MCIRDSYYWDPSVAPSSLLIYNGENYPNWQSSWFVTTLREKTLLRFTKSGSKFVEERLYQNEFGRIRKIETSPAGDLFLLTDGSKGSLIKILGKSCWLLSSWISVLEINGFPLLSHSALLSGSWSISVPWSSEFGDENRFSGVSIINIAFGFC